MKNLTTEQITEYINKNYNDFINKYYTAVEHLGHDMFHDLWEMHCDNNNIKYTQSHLVALVEWAEKIGHIEEGDILIGTRGT